MSLSLTMTKAFLDAKGFKYTAYDSEGYIKTGFGGLKSKGSIAINLFFDKDDRTVGIRSFDFCEFPADKKSKMYEVCSKMNQEYRWVKFYVDEKENSVTIADDAIIQLDSCGEEIFELMYRLADIADDVYPEFMKAIWQ